MKMSFVGRKFQFWLYHVSHGELLVRSPRGEEHPRNVDVMFADVVYLETPRFLPDLEIDEPSEGEVARAGERLGRSVEARDVIVLKSEGRRFLVVAASVQVVESDMDIFDSPFA